MKEIVFFISFLGALTTWAYSPESCGYHIDKNELRYCNELVVGADVNTWATLEGGDSPSDWGHDKDHPFFRGKKLANVSSKGFQVLNSVYVKDNERIYVSDELNGSFDYREVPAKPTEAIKKFIDSDSYIQVGQNIFYRGRHLSGLDPKNARIMGGGMTDGKLVFWNDILIKGIDASNLSIPFDSRFMISDGKNVFYKNVRLPGVDIANMKRVDGIRYYKDSKRVYTLNTMENFFIPVPQIDANDFAPAKGVDSSLGCRSYREAEVHGVIFQCDERLMTKDAMMYLLKRAGHAIDSKNFQLLETVSGSPFGEGRQNYFFAKDGNAVYFENHKIEGADPKTFRILKIQYDSKNFGNSLYSADKDNVYYLNKKLPGVLPKKIKLTRYAGRDRLTFKNKIFDFGIEHEDSEDDDAFRKKLIESWYPVF